MIRPSTIRDRYEKVQPKDFDNYTSKETLLSVYTARSQVSSLSSRSFDVQELKDSICLSFSTLSQVSKNECDSYLGSYKNMNNYFITLKHNRTQSITCSEISPLLGVDDSKSMRHNHRSNLSVLPISTHFKYVGSSWERFWSSRMLHWMFIGFTSLNIIRMSERLIEMNSIDFFSRKFFDLSCRLGCSGLCTSILLIGMKVMKFYYTVIVESISCIILLLSYYYDIHMNYSLVIFSNLASVRLNSLAFISVYGIHSSYLYLFVQDVQMKERVPKTSLIAKNDIKACKSKYTSWEKHS